MKLLKLCSLIVLLLVDASMYALDSGFEIANIYRHDDYQRHNVAAMVPPTEDSIDRIKVDNVNLWQIGIKGRLTPPKDHFYWNNNQLLSLLNNFYLDGFTYWGWSKNSGQINENIHNLITGNTSKSKANLKKVFTFDLQFGLGYLLEWNCFGLGVSGGYAYNTQRVKPKHGEFSLAAMPSPLDRQILTNSFHTRTIWKGPWVGVELFYELANWTFNAGYEHHFALYTVNHYRNIDSFAPQPPQPFFEDGTHSNHAYGNIAFMDVKYNFCEGWTAGTTLKYQHWQANHGHLWPDDVTFVEAGLPATTEITATGSWISYSVSLDLGYSF